ncbi:DUF4362 domain-containing protein [Sporosarcina sp. 179-K 8C2 HS]|uniref:DUF4362 domain-containing protein n=1 Tax=Sporosarcina sp. 179-K 8C2 HS TaxID=3142387 RepID=UPI0039A38DC7
MKKMGCSILLLIFLFALTACNASDEEKNPIDKEETVATSKDNAKPSVKGVRNVDVVNTHGSIEGLERMQNFYHNVQNGISSELRIVQYTEEGDPMVKDLTYNGDSLQVQYDTTRDNFGNGRISKINCSNMIEEVNPTNTSYIATDCDEGIYGKDSILVINYNMKKQDLFEFELKYGVNLDNEVNTKTNKVKKVLNTMETEVISDFVLASHVKQEVYKKLVMTNYLEVKDLKATCDSNEAMNYYLKVYINGAQRDYHWSNCDRSSDGKNFTGIAEYIIQQAEIKQAANSETEIQGYILQMKDDTLLIGVDLNILDYESLKDEIQHINLSAYVFDFISLEGVKTDEFRIGDKIEATIKGSITGSNPGRAQVKGIKKLYITN